MTGPGTKSAPELWAEVNGAVVAKGTLALWWLYQSGIILKTPGGTVVVIDAYLSDAVMQTYKLPRNVPAPLDPLEVEADAVLATHSHADHLDPGSISAFFSHGRARFLGPPMAVDVVTAAGVPAARTTAVHRGETHHIGDLSVRAVHARHLFGLEPTPDAVGFVLAAGDVSIYHSGDTEYDSEIVADTKGVTASFISINGTTGNMNAHEAAMLAWLQGTRLAVPFHYGLWRDADYGPGATLGPELFVATYHRLAPDGATLVLTPGQAVVIDAHGLVT